MEMVQKLHHSHPAIISYFMEMEFARYLKLRPNSPEAFHFSPCSNLTHVCHILIDFRKMCEQENENHGYYILQTLEDTAPRTPVHDRVVNDGEPFGVIIHFLCREGTDSTDCCHNPTNGRRMASSPSMQELVTLPLTIPHIHAIFADSSVDRVVLPQYVSSYVRDVLFSEPVDDSVDPIGLLPLPPTSGGSGTCMVTSNKTRVDSCSMVGSPCGSYYVEIMDGVLGSCTASGPLRCTRKASVFELCS